MVMLKPLILLFNTVNVSVPEAAPPEIPPMVVAKVRVEDEAVIVISFPTVRLTVWEVEADVAAEAF